MTALGRNEKSSPRKLGLLLNLAEGYAVGFYGFLEVGDTAEGFTEITLLKKSLKRLG